MAVSVREHSANGCIRFFCQLFRLFDGRFIRNSAPFLDDVKGSYVLGAIRFESGRRRQRVFLVSNREKNMREQLLRDRVTFSRHIAHYGPLS